MLEGLENRCLLSATLNAATGVLSVTGTAGPDVIRLGRGGSQVVVVESGSARSFDASKVKSITIDGRAGNDLITLHGSGTPAGGGEISVPATLAGGAGNDLLTGGTAADALSGG